MTSRGVAGFVSKAFSPPLVVCYGAAALLPRTGGEIFWAPLIIAVFVGPPVAYVLYLLRKGAVSGFHLSKQTERFRPLKFMVINTAAGMLVFSRLGSPALVLDVVLACLIALLAVYAVTLGYKVSAHSAAISSLAVILLFLYGAVGAVGAVLIPVVSWARVRLAAHTAAQTVAGFVIGGAVTFAVLAFKGRF
ncbi:MAG: hypothetical protein OXF45_03770 [Candidatus Dadabacteria bacterium]|nr:hypothetical protein [Candidatus Dadabacteria bacterium]